MVPFGPLGAQEPCVVATLRERNSVIFHDNDFEVFIDPDASNHNYYELEVSFLGFRFLQSKSCHKCLTR